MKKEVKWDERFNIGVDNIDKAHQKLFSIVRKLIYLNQEEKKGQWACAEGIKFFKYYADKHFAEEEAYMISIHYPGYELHKHLHDDLRNKTLPALERDLVMSDYSPESDRRPCHNRDNFSQVEKRTVCIRCPDIGSCCR